MYTVFNQANPTEVNEQTEVKTSADAASTVKARDAMLYREHSLPNEDEDHFFQRVDGYSFMLTSEFERLY